MNKSEIHRNLQSKIAYNKIKEVFDFLLEDLVINYKPFDSNLIDRIVASSNKFIQLKEDEISGLVSWEKLQIEKTRHTAQLIQIINKIPKTKFTIRKKTDTETDVKEGENLPISYDDHISIIREIQFERNNIYQTLKQQ